MILAFFIQPAATMLEPAAALAQLRSAYTQTAVADSITFETSRSDGTFDAASARILIDPAGDAIRFETAGFTFLASKGTLVGIDAQRDDPRRALIVRQPGSTASDLLTTIVPTGPLPQLWEPDATEVIDPSIGAIRFTSAQLRDSATVISGISAFGPVFVEIDTASGRLITLRTSLRDGSLELRASPAEPGDPGDWGIETDGLRPVERIDQLAPSLPRLAEGGVLPDLSLLAIDSFGLNLSDWHEAPDAQSPRAPWSVLVFADATARDPQVALADAKSHLDGISAAAIERRVASPAERFWLRFRPLVVLVMPDDFALSNRPAVEPEAGVDVLLSTSPIQTLDRLPSARTVAVAIDRDRVIGGLGAGDSKAAIEAFIDALLRPTANPPADTPSPD